MISHNALEPILLYKETIYIVGWLSDLDEIRITIVNYQEASSDCIELMKYYVSREEIERKGDCVEFELNLPYLYCNGASIAIKEREDFLVNVGASTGSIEISKCEGNLISGTISSQIFKFGKFQNLEFD